MQSDCTTLAGTGATIAGVKYMFVRGAKGDSEVYVKKGNTGVVFQKCNTCIVVAHHDDKIQPGACATATGKLADWMRENNI